MTILDKIFKNWTLIKANYVMHNTKVPEEIYKIFDDQIWYDSTWPNPKKLFTPPLRININILIIMAKPFITNITFQLLYTEFEKRKVKINKTHKKRLRLLKRTFKNEY